MKFSIVAVLSMFIGLALVAPLDASVGEKCEVCGTSGGVEMFSSFDGGFGETCVDLTGNGYGFDDCTVYYVGSGYTFCDTHGQPECQNGAVLALVTGVDGYLVADELSALQREELLREGMARRACDGAIIGRQFSNYRASSNAGSSSRVSI